MNISDIGANNLREAIINQAMNDYKLALNGEGFGRQTPLSVKRECEKFFRSEWFQSLTNGIDGEKTIEVLKMQAVYEKWRKKTGCIKCKVKTCVHRSGKHFTAVEKGELNCGKEDKKKMRTTRRWKRFHRDYADIIEWVEAFVGGISVFATIYLLYMILWFFS